jgi:hypothetical protein
VLAVGLLAGAVLLYTRVRDLIVPLMVITPILVGFAGARVLLWPDSLPLRVAVEVGYRIILLTAAIASAARPPRTLGTLGVVARSVFADASSFLAAFHRPNSRRGISGRRDCAGREHAAGCNG